MTKKQVPIDGSIHWTTAYNIGDSVMIDGSLDIKAVILAVVIRGTGRNVNYDVAWFHNGSSYSAWIEEWRILPWED